MIQAWRQIERLIEVNAEHRKGFRLTEVGPDFVLRQAAEELRELTEAPSDITELADLFGVLIHYAIKRGWTIAQLEEVLLMKLGLRFSEEA
jgi:hypothetical protein